MHYLRSLSILAGSIGALAGCGSSDSSLDPETLVSSTVLDLNDVKSTPTDYEWSDFRPNVKKLILAGAAETEHIAILWYTVPDSGVGPHYHSKTESVYVIDGTQTDAKGTYPTGTVYFNPPSSGHEITMSSGFFVLAYASPPDFSGTHPIEEYMPVRIDTEDPDLTTNQPFEAAEEEGVQVFTPPLDSTGDLGAELIETTSSASHDYAGNYLLVLEGSCEVDGMTLGEDMLVVAKAVTPTPYTLAASPGSTCLTLGVSF